MFYEPVKSERYFERDHRYSEINWNSFRDVVDAFDRRIRGWYVEPVEILLERGLTELVKIDVRGRTGRQNGAHYSFTVMAMTCMLIDALSQYSFGELASGGKHFERFVRQCLPSYGGMLPVSICHYDHKYAMNGKPLQHYSEVIWSGFRCGILHQAHAPLYCGIVPGKDPPKVEISNSATYSAGATNSVNGTNCPVVVICPEHLFNEVMAYFGGYLQNLKDKDSRHDQLRIDFGKKFADSFGVDLASATL